MELEQALKEQITQAHKRLCEHLEDMQGELNTSKAYASLRNDMRHCAWNLTSMSSKFCVLAGEYDALVALASKYAIT